ncbi:hypothetical protein MPER_03299, partial [Moniliophthora perniciosa FA553]
LLEGSSEHIDYCLFGVLPAAIEQDILIACAPRKSESHEPGHVVAENAHAKYTRQTFSPSQQRRGSVTEGQVHIEEWHLDINKKELRWESYVKAGYYGVLNTYFSGGAGGNLPIPVDLLVTGTVPAGSGLSSSAAMVVASTLTFLAVNGKLSPDQNVTKGRLVSLAVATNIVLGGCVQPLAAAIVLAKHLGVAVGEKEKIQLREVLGRWAGEDKDVGALGEEKLLESLEKISDKLDILKPAKQEQGQLGVTLEEMIEKTGLLKEAFEEIYLSWVEVEATQFQLYKRAKHVFKLNQLTQLARDAGAFGSRLT